MGLRSPPIAQALRRFDPYPEFDNVRVFKGRPETGGRQFYKTAGLIVPRFEMVPGVQIVGGAGFGQREINGAWRGARADEPLIGDGGLRNAEARTNSIRNPVVAGAGGAKIGAGTINGLVPDGMTVSAASGTTVTLSKATIAGQTFLIAEVFGTPATSPHFGLLTETGLSVAATNGQTWALASEVAILAGSMSGVAFASQRFTMRDATNTGIGDKVSSDFRALLTAEPTEFRAALTTDQALTASIVPQIAFSGSGSPVSYTVAIGLPNLKLGPDINDPPILQESGLPATRTGYSYFESGRDIAPVHYGVVRARLLAPLANHASGFPSLLDIRASSGSARVTWFGLQSDGSQRFGAIGNDGTTTFINPGVNPVVGAYQTFAWALREGSLTISRNGEAVQSLGFGGVVSGLSRVGWMGSAQTLGAATSNAEAELCLTANGAISDAALQALAARFAA